MIDGPTQAAADAAAAHRQPRTGKPTLEDKLALALNTEYSTRDELASVLLDLLVQAHHSEDDPGMVLRMAETLLSRFTEIEQPEGLDDLVLEGTPVPTHTFRRLAKELKPQVDEFCNEAYRQNSLDDLSRQFMTWFLHDVMDTRHRDESRTRATVWLTLLIQSGFLPYSPIPDHLWKAIQGADKLDTGELATAALEASATIKHLQGRGLTGTQMLAAFSAMVEGCGDGEEAAVGTIGAIHIAMNIDRPEPQVPPLLMLLMNSRPD